MIDAPTSESGQPTAQPAPPPEPAIDKVVIAIHGIGSQRRSDTIRSVARRFGSRSTPPLPVMPLGFFHIGNAGEVHVSRLDASPTDPVARIGFAEVFWADIPRQVVMEDDTLEETKAWGTSVVSRAQATYLSSVKQRRLTPQDFALGAGVVEEIVETVGVMENLLAVAEKAGVFKFELAPLLRDYIGDVQLVTEFKFYRDRIIYRFHSAMAQIVERFRLKYPDRWPEIHIVAHSEGTVVSFLGLLQALSGVPVVDPEKDPNDPATRHLDTSWIRHVRGFMTIGSPIDKHIVLWPKLWEDLELSGRINAAGVVELGEAGRPRLELPQRIKWRNYYDFGDPIGFKLETAVELLHDKQCEAFEFVTKDHDFGFSRYWLPGKAHNDYWDDPEVFGHFIDDVVLPTGKAVPPKDRILAEEVSKSIPYALTALLHLAAVFVLCKAVAAFPSTHGLSQEAMFQHLALQIGLLSGLLLSVTIAARLPRLVKTGGLRWHLAALLTFLLGAIPCALALPRDVAVSLARPFGLVTSWPVAEAHVGIAALLMLAAVVAVSGWLVPRRPRIARRTLILSGAAVVSLIVVERLVADESHAQVSVWPVVLGGLAFLYLWWLGILLFDLTFIWHRYIRQSVAVETLREWKRGEDAQPHPMMGLKRGAKAPSR